MHKITDPALALWAICIVMAKVEPQKLVLNEFVAYVAYTDMADQFSPVASAITIFALCGFANLSSIAILLGGLGAIAPARRDEISRFGLRALLAATLSNLMSAALASSRLSTSRY